jgi:hypothetical protein
VPEDHLIHLRIHSDAIGWLRRRAILSAVRTPAFPHHGLPARMTANVVIWMKAQPGKPTAEALPS